MDISSATRKGVINGKIHRTKLQSDSGELTKVVFFDILSLIDVGQNEVVEEVAKVLLIGEAAEHLDLLPFKPKAGDTVRVYNSLCYVRGGVLCFRCLYGGQVEIDPATGIPASSEATKVKTVEAKAYFGKLIPNNSK